MIEEIWMTEPLQQMTTEISTERMAQLMLVVRQKEATNMPRSLLILHTVVDSMTRTHLKRINQQIITKMKMQLKMMEHLQANPLYQIHMRMIYQRSCLLEESRTVGQQNRVRRASETEGGQQNQQGKIISLLYKKVADQISREQMVTHLRVSRLMMDTLPKVKPMDIHLRASQHLANIRISLHTEVVRARKLLLMDTLLKVILRLTITLYLQANLMNQLH
mmetsp:Transcript_3559/g.5282  ORF Transcript_3559/g.5282 Transcript_3559/m.5282 type:complete len:220 (+) Transcript_3559:1806-2465(+)